MSNLPNSELGDVKVEVNDRVQHSDVDAGYMALVEELRRDVEILKSAKERMRTSLFKRATEWAGLLALAIAIATGGFTLNDKLFGEPRKEREALSVALDSAVEQITQTNQELIQAHASLSPDQVQALGSVLNGIKFSATRKAQEIIDENPDLATPTTLLVIAGEQLGSGQYSKALSNADLALALSEETWWQAEAHRYRALAIAAPGTNDALMAGDDAFEMAYALVSNERAGQAIAALGNTFRDWTNMYLVAGQCEKADLIWVRFQTTMTMPAFTLLKPKYADYIRKVADKTTCTLSPL